MHFVGIRCVPFTIGDTKLYICSYWYCIYNDVIEESCL